MERVPGISSLNGILQGYKMLCSSFLFRKSRIFYGLLKPAILIPHFKKGTEKTTCRSKDLCSIAIKKNHWQISQTLKNEWVFNWGNIYFRTEYFGLRQTSKWLTDCIASLKEQLSTHLAAMCRSKLWQPFELYVVYKKAIWVARKCTKEENRGVSTQKLMNCC